MDRLGGEDEEKLEKDLNLALGRDAEIFGLKVCERPPLLPKLLRLKKLLPEKLDRTDVDRLPPSFGMDHKKVIVFSIQELNFLRKKSTLVCDGCLFLILLGHGVSMWTRRDKEYILRLCLLPREKYIRGGIYRGLSPLSKS